MGILDIFRSKKLAESENQDERKVKVMHTQAQGSSGTDITGGILNEEYLSELNGTQRADEFDKMRRNEPKVKMCLNAVMNPIKKANWEIEAGGDSETEKMHRDFAEFAIFDGMTKTWRKLLHEILTMTFHGYSLFERTHKVELNHPKWGSHVRLNNLAFRSQRTIEFWNIDNDTEELRSVTQYAFGDGQQSNVDMDARFLSLFAIDQEGKNFEGISLLRPCYGAWKRKHVFLKLNAIGIEKFAVPTPELEIPEGKENTEEYDNAIEVLENYTSHQSNYLTRPKGWELQVHTNRYDPQKVLEVIKFEGSEMVDAFLANFLELGRSGQGSYALSFDLSDFFLNGIEYIADIITEEFNQALIPELIKLNWGPQQTYPKMKVSGISDRIGEELGKLLKALADGGYITPDDGIEEHLRRRLKLPKFTGEGTRQPKQPTLFAEKKNDSIRLAETVRGILKDEDQKLFEFMSSELSKIGKEMAQKIYNKHKSLPDSKKLDAMNNVSATGMTGYKSTLKQALVDASDRALTQARKEVPATKDVKLAEFEDLPRSEQIRLTKLSQQLVGTQIADLEKTIFFQFMQSDKDTKSSEIIRKDMEDAADSFSTSASVRAAAGNTVAFVVNSARQAYFYDDKVLKEIHAFKFMNRDPDTPICKDLNGRIFSKDDPESERFRPPLHHNCKSYIVPILMKNAGRFKIDDRGLKPSDPKLEKGITL